MPQSGLAGGPVLPVLVAILTLLCTGCPITLPEPVPFFDDTLNDSFAAATQLPLTSTDALVFDSQIETPFDLDLFQLGPLNPGDQVHVDLQAADGGLDLTAAVFDSHELLQLYNDDRTPNSSNLNPLLDFVLRTGPDTYFLGVSTYYDDPSTGGYRVDLRITRGVGVPEPSGQIVYLDWVGGADIVIPNVGAFDLPPFDAADLGTAYAGRTAQMKDRIQTIVAERYAGYDLVLRNSDVDPLPPEPHSTVYFGGTSAQAFAISEQVDTLNADPSDVTIIFVDSFRTAFVTMPTFEQMAQAVGNTVAHELGHLLGLVHTKDCDDLMDSGCYNERLFFPQSLSTASISPRVFPVGLQPAREIVAWVLGLIGM